jgi:hypothetical protein
MVMARDFWRQRFDPQRFTISHCFAGVPWRLLKSPHVLETFWRRSVAPLARLRTLRYTAVVTRTLDAAIAKLATLPPEEQDRVGLWLLEELADEEQWTRTFEASQDTLSKLATEARADRAAGRTTDVDSDNL